MGRCIGITKLFTAGMIAAGCFCGQSQVNQPAGSEFHLHLVSSQQAQHHAVPAVVWLEPLGSMPPVSFTPHGHYTLLQKNRTFVPHLLVIPTGSVVQFPNADPFFHNVFSLFDGKRFDLGLYEAGSSKSVTFSREGVSYIFCNLHPEMSAVVLSISTPLYALADANNAFTLHNVPAGDYKMNIWVEGVPQALLNGLARQVHLDGHPLELGELRVPLAAPDKMSHTNKFGRPYEPDTKSSY